MIDPIVEALELPDDTPAWYAHLALATGHAEDFPEDIKVADNAELKRWAWTFDFARQLDALGFDFVPGYLHGDFLEIVAELERACKAEATRRGLTFRFDALVTRQ